MEIKRIPNFCCPYPRSLGRWLELPSAVIEQLQAEGHKVTAAPQISIDVAG